MAAGAGDRYSDLLRHDTVPFQAIGMMQQAEQPGSQPVWLTEDSTLPDARGANLAHPASAIFNIPASWHDYLSGPAPAVTAHEHQEQQVTNDSSAGSKAEQTAAALQTKQEAKQQRIREKNRRAMQKFRNKQREKSEQAEARVQELTKQVSDLTVQVETLQQEKLQLLQQDRACPNTKYAVPGCEVSFHSWLMPFTVATGLDPVLASLCSAHQAAVIPAVYRATCFSTNMH